MALNDLRLIEAICITPVDVAEKRRWKLLQALDRNLAALEKQPLRLPTRQRWIFQQPDGSYQLAVMYGKKQLELAKGKRGIACANVEQLISSLKLIRQTILDGKLDRQIEDAAADIRRGFGKSKTAN